LIRYLRSAVVRAVIGTMAAANMSRAIIRTAPATRKLHCVVAFSRCVVRAVVTATAAALVACTIVRAAPTACQLLGAIVLALKNALARCGRRGAGACLNRSGQGDCGDQSANQCQLACHVSSPQKREVPSTPLA
jgi:hypothetical protein